MKAQGFILGAFFYGYTMTNIAGGMIARKIGGKITMLFGVFWTAFLTLLTPILTTVGGFWAIFFVRLFEGIGEVSNDMSKANRRMDVFILFEQELTLAATNRSCISICVTKIWDLGASMGND